jgi:hypothetical protein
VAFRKRVVLLISIMAVVCLGIEAITIGMLYKTALQEERQRLEETAKSQARLIEAVARNDAEHNPISSVAGQNATLDIITDAHNHYTGFGNTGEFTLSKRDGDKIVFLIDHRHYDLQNPKPVPFNSNLAEPMRLALRGKSGTIIGLDYRGVQVLAAHEPVSELNWGIVAKIDLVEIRKPFIKAALISGIIGILLVLFGALLFIRVTNPLLKKLTETVETLRKALSEVKQLSGLLPICASCKKIRDDKGYWKRIEYYIREHSDADFSHSVCPECARKLYPELKLKAQK